MQKEIELTREFLVELGISEKALKEFDKRFPDGSVTVPEFLKFCEELNLFSLAQSIIRIKKGFECSDKIICQKLFVDGDLTLRGEAKIHGDVDAETLNMSECARIHGNVNTKTLNMSGEARIHGNVNTKTLNMSGEARIHGNVNTKTLNMHEN